MNNVTPISAAGENLQEMANLGALIAWPLMGRPLHGFMADLSDANGHPLTIEEAAVFIEAGKLHIVAATARVLLDGLIQARNR